MDILRGERRGATTPELTHSMAIEIACSSVIAYINQGVYTGSDSRAIRRFTWLYPGCNSFGPGIYHKNLAVQCISSILTTNLHLMPYFMLLQCPVSDQKGDGDSRPRLFIKCALEVLRMI